MRDVAILCYHAVSPRWDADLSVTPAALDRQIGHLLSRGWRATTFSEAVLGDATGRVLAVTFDDAFASVGLYARPILARHRVPATVFAPTEFMDGGRDLEWPGVEHWKRTEFARELVPMGWSDLRELAKDGWEIGSHTCTHPHLTALDDEALARELTRSRARCIDELGGCRSIAYPYGDVDGRVVSAAIDAGYATGAKLSRDLRREGAHLAPRIGIYHGDDWRRFRLKLSRPTRLARAVPLGR